MVIIYYNNIPGWWVIKLCVREFHAIEVHVNGNRTQTRSVDCKYAYRIGIRADWFRFHVYRWRRKTGIFPIHARITTIIMYETNKNRFITCIVTLSSSRAWKHRYVGKYFVRLRARLIFIRGRWECNTMLSLGKRNEIVFKSINVINNI